MPASIDIKELARREHSPRTDSIHPRRHIFSRFVLPGVLIAGFLALFAWSTRDAYLPRKPVQVVPVLVSLADVQTAGTPLFKAAGWIEPRPTSIRVTALAPGVVRELLVVEDQQVSQGDPIAYLIDEDAKLEVELAEATLQLKQAELQEAEAALAAATTNLNVPAHLEAALAEVEATLAAIATELTNLPNQLQGAEARLQLARISLESKEAALSVPAILIDQARSDFGAAQADVNELEQRLPLLDQQRTALTRQRDALATRLELKTDEHEAVAIAESRVSAANARVHEAEVTLATVELRFERMTIPAPVDGRILNLIASPGMQLMTGLVVGENGDGGTVVTMYQPSQLQVRTDVRFEDLPRVIRDQPVMIESPALSAPLTGRVLFLTGFANIQKNTLEVKVSLDAPPEVIKPDMLVDVTFLAPEQETAAEASTSEYRIFVPRELVELEGDAASVWVADLAAQTAHRTPVTLGSIQTPELLEIAGGLSAGSRVISTGREDLEDGDRIEVVGEDLNLGAGMNTDIGDTADAPAQHPHHDGTNE